MIWFQLSTKTTGEQCIRDKLDYRTKSIGITHTQPPSPNAELIIHEHLQQVQIINFPL